MVWFANRARRGLTNRAYERIAGEHGPGSASLILAVGIAAAVYPDASYGTDECDQFNGHLPSPNVNTKRAGELAESYVDHGSISLSSCMQKLYGKNQDEFVATVMNATLSREKSDFRHRVSDVDAAAANHDKTGNSTIEDAFAAVCNQYATYTSDDPIGQQQLVGISASLRAHYASQRRELSTCADSCIMRFANVELDFETPHRRGIGRMTDHIPRFAAKHRDEFMRMRPEVIEEIKCAIMRHIICGYLYLEFMRKLPLLDESKYDSSTLFDVWAPLIYQPPQHLDPQSEDESDIRGIWFAATGRSIRDVAIRAGIHWSSDDAIGTDLAIITHYFDAGTTLRFAEATLIQ